MYRIILKRGRWFEPVIRPPRRPGLAFIDFLCALSISFVPTVALRASDTRRRHTGSQLRYFILWGDLTTLLTEEKSRTLLSFLVIIILYRCHLILAAIIVNIMHFVLLLGQSRVDLEHKIKRHIIVVWICVNTLSNAFKNCFCLPYKVLIRRAVTLY